MNRAERLSAILDLLAESGRLQVEDIVERLGVSPATARRDLDALAEQQLLGRTRGGAVSHSVAYDLPVRYKNQQRRDAKRAIARAASALVPRGAIVGLSGGTTATAIADELMSRGDVMAHADDPGLTVVTNAVNIAMQLALRPQIKTVVVGGVLHPRSYELVGPHAEETLARINLDLAFIGANALHPDHGATTHDEREAAVNAAMARRAERAVLVVDSAKLDKRVFAVVGPERLFDTVITDGEATAEQRARLADRGYDVIVAAD